MLLYIYIYVYIFLYFCNNVTAKGNTSLMLNELGLLVLLIRSCVSVHLLV